MRLVWLLVCVLPVAFAQSFTLDNVLLAGIFPLTGADAQVGYTIDSVAHLAVSWVNNDTTLLPNSNVILQSFDDLTSDLGGLNAAIDAAEYGFMGIIGSIDSEVSKIVATAATLYLMPQISPGSTRSTLDDKTKYSLFNRVVPPDGYQSDALAAIIIKYGWQDRVSVIGTSDEYGIALVEEFQRVSQDQNINIRVIQQFQPGRTNINVEMDSMLKSHARVIVALMGAADFQTVLQNADSRKMAGEGFVWLCSDGCASTEVFYNPDGSFNQRYRQLTRGLIGTRLRGGYGKFYDQILKIWQDSSVVDFPGAGDQDMGILPPYTFDAVLAFCHALQDMADNNVNFTVVNINAAIKDVNFNGITGPVRLDSKGNRIAEYSIVNLRDADMEFTEIGYFRCSDSNLCDITGFGSKNDLGLTLESKIQFWSGEESLGDPFYSRAPFDYWSCYDKEMKTAEYGLHVKLTPPSGDNPDNIASHYRCDQFLDCSNMSDEWGCAASLPAAFIAYGIIIVVLCIIDLFFAAFTIAFGYIWKRRAVRAASPFFLLIICAACFVGFCSVFTFYGKPSPYSCPWSPWLVCLPLCVMLSALMAKSFRIWRLYRSPVEVNALTDWQLLIFAIVLTIPMVILLFLWTLLGTPTAELINRDGYPHYVCTAGGVVGGAAGLVMFILVVVYFGIILLFGVFLSIVTRHVESAFNESKLIAISIYNLAVLGVIGIPVYFIMLNNSNLGAWILLSSFILYGFGTTLFLQFVPKVWRVSVRDRFQPPKSSRTGTGTGGRDETGTVSNFESKVMESMFG